MAGGGLTCAVAYNKVHPFSWLHAIPLIEHIILYFLSRNTLFHFGAVDIRVATDISLPCVSS